MTVHLLPQNPHEFSFYAQYQQVIVRGLVRDLKDPGDRGLMDGNIHSGRMGMLKELAKVSPKPDHAALLEVAFLTNPDDFIKSISENPNFISDVIAPAIVSSIKDILKSNRKPVAAINIRPPSPVDPSKYNQMTVRLTTSKRLTEKPTLKYTPRGASSITLSPVDRGLGVTTIRNIMWEATKNIPKSTPRGTAIFSYLGTDIGGISDTTIMVGKDFLFTPIVTSTTQQGISTSTFTQGDYVYIKGSGYATNTTYNVYIASNKT